MRILLVANYEPDHQQSMLRFSDLLESELQKGGHAVKVIRPEVHVGRLTRTERGLGKWLGYADKFVLFAMRLRQAAATTDVVHICDQAYALHTRYLRSVPHVVTCHDLFAARCALGEFSWFHTKWSGRRYQRMILNGLAQAGHVACDSEATRSDVLRLCNLRSRSASTIHNALNFPYRPVSEGEKAVRLSRLGISPGSRFILHVGGPSPYKNQPGVIRIFRHLTDRLPEHSLGLLIVSTKLTTAVSSLIEHCGLQAKVRVLSDLAPEDLRVLYSSATAFLFPSLHEGFGWPIIEAQACGCPVFTSNRPPMMTEIGGDGAVYIDPEDPQAAAITIAENLPHVSQMREAGFANVRRFSPEKMVTGYLKAYASAIKSVSALRSEEKAKEAGRADFDAYCSGPCPGAGAINERSN
jgi:glycosyltransferase involved in cell wall biosynthesis